MKKKIKKVVPVAKKKLQKPRTKWPLFGRVTVRERLIFVKQLSIMIKAGLTMREGLQVVRDQSHSRTFVFMLDQLIADVENGQYLADSMAKFPRVFDDFAVSLVRVGEESGQLSENLKYLAEQLENNQELSRKVRSALLYPSIVLSGTVGITTFLSFVTLPQLVPIFKSLQIKLPPTTQFLLTFTTAVRDHWLAILVVLAIIFVMAKFLYRFRTIQFASHRTILSLPIIGKISRNVQLTHFSRILATLLQSGVEVIRALEITAASMSNVVYRYLVVAIARDLETQGESFTAYLERDGRFFPPTVQRIVEVGDRTGNLVGSLLYISEFYEKEVDNSLKNLTNILEPIILLVMGVIVGFVALSIITPIYELTRTVNG